MTPLLLLPLPLLLLPVLLPPKSWLMLLLLLKLPLTLPLQKSLLTLLLPLNWSRQMLSRLPRLQLTQPQLLQPLP
jgi:hypothetical protein